MNHLIDFGVCALVGCTSNIMDSRLNMTQVDFYPSINVMWINLLVFQTPDGNRFAKEIG